MAFPVLSTYRLQMRGDCFTFADAEQLIALPRRPRRVAPVPVADPDRAPRLHATATTSPTPPPCPPELGGADGLGPAVGGSAVARHGPDRRHRAQPRRRRRPRAEQVVVGRARSTAGTRRYASYFDIDWTLDRRPNRVAGAGFRRRRRRSRGRRRRAAARRPRLPHRAGNRDRQRPRGARPPALPADRLAQRRLRLPAVLLDHLAGRPAPGGPRRVRRHPRRGQALVRRGSGRRRAHRPPGRIVRPRRLSGVAAGDHRAATRGSSSRRSWPSTSRWIRACPWRAPPVTTRCARSAACSSTPPASGR